MGLLGLDAGKLREERFPGMDGGGYVQRICFHLKDWIIISAP